MCCHILSYRLVSFHQLSNDKTAFLDHNWSVCADLFCLPLRVCERQKDMISFAPQVSGESVCSHRHTHTDQWAPALSPLTASSFITAWMDQRVREKRGLQRHFPCPEKSSDSGPGGSTLVPMWRLEGGQSHNSTVFDRAVIGCVYHPHSILISLLSESFTQQKTHTCFTSCWWNPEARCDPSLTALASCFPHFKAPKHLFFTHPTSPTHTAHS